jgi:hypothetical protein
MPTEEELPPGPVRNFVVMLFHLFKKAHRPTLREISDAIRDNEELRGTASPETIRRMLRGKTVPQRWEIVEAAMLTLCRFAGISPDADVIFGDEDDSSKDTIRNHVERMWHEALDNPNLHYRRGTRHQRDPVVEPSRKPDPWAGDPWASPFSDDPPF